jgi:hypothetical protein
VWAAVGNQQTEGWENVLRLLTTISSLGDPVASCRRHPSIGRYMRYKFQGAGTSSEGVLVSIDLNAAAGSE